MASVKLKFRVSSLPEKEGTLYFQIIHERVVKQIGTAYRIFESEWDEQCNDIVKSSCISPNRQELIKSIREKIAWDKNRLNRIIRSFEDGRQPFSTDDIVQEYYALSFNRTTVFEYQSSNRKTEKYWERPDLRDIQTNASQFYEIQEW